MHQRCVVVWRLKYRVASRRFCFGRRLLRLQIHVDEPCISVSGKEIQCRVLLSCLIPLWVALGFKLAFGKADWGESVQWISDQLGLERAGAASAKISSRLSKNVISKKEFNVCAGK